MVTDNRLRQRAQVLLEIMLGPGSRFREGQWEAIEAVVGQRQRPEVAQRTGWGQAEVLFQSLLEQAFAEGL